MAQESIGAVEHPQGELMGRYARSFALEEDEAQAIDHLLGFQHFYPTDKYIPPMRPPRRADKARPVFVAQIVADERDEFEDPTPLAIELADDEVTETVPLVGVENPAEELARVLFRHRHRASYIGFWRGARHDFHLLFRHYAAGLIALGFSLQPLAAGASIKAVIVKKGRTRWWLCDIPAMTGADVDDLEGFIDAYTDSPGHELDGLRLLREAVLGYQAMTMDLFQTALRPTVGGAAIHAAQVTLPEDAWKWRPPPLLVAMAREGRGYRGGYVLATPYVGKAWKADINKAYTAALSSELPLETAFGPAVVDGDIRPGLYLSRIHGPGPLPLYIAPWQGPEEGFVLGAWAGDECLAIIPSSEVSGIRALGYRVDPLFGFRYTRTFSFGAYVERITELLTNHERGSAEVRAAKLFGVSVYGKLAERPERQDMQYREKDPGEEWFPAFAEDGEEIPGLWLRKSVSYRPHQHIDVAASITGEVRGKVYQAAADIHAAGGNIVAVDTDGIIADIDLRDVLAIHDTRLGAWRYEGHDARAAIAGNKAYAFGPAARVAGVHGVTRAQVELAARGDDIIVAGKRIAPPWEGGAMFVPLVRTVHGA